MVLLADRGLVDLDEPISRYVDLPVKDNGATVRQLLNMRSGLRDYVGGPQFDKAAQNLDRHWSPDEALRDVPDEVDTAGAACTTTSSAATGSSASPCRTPTGRRHRWCSRIRR